VFSQPEPGEDLFLEELVLELLLAEHLSGLLTAAHQIGHHLVCGAEGHVLIDWEALRGNFAGHLV
jgi:hypothetical protein